MQFVVIKAGEQPGTTVVELSEISGIVTDLRKQPVVGAVVLVTKDGIVKGGTMTDIDGNYIIKPLDVGTYQLDISYGSSKARVLNVAATKGWVEQHITLDLLNEGMVVSNYKKPLITTTHAAKVQDIADLQPQLYQSRRGGVAVAGARKTGTLYIIDGVQVQNIGEEAVAAPAKKDSLLAPNRKVYNREEVQKMNIR